MGFLDPGPLIVVRLRTRFAAAGLTASVGTAVDGGAIVETPQTEPAAYVVFDGYEPAQEVGSGLVQQIEQRWAVIVKQRLVSGLNLDDGAPAAADAAPVIDAVLEALCGWRPGTGFDQLRMAEGSGPACSSGYAYYSLFFTTRTVVRGVP